MSAGILGVLMATTACGGGSSNEGAGPGDGTITLQFAWWGSDTRHEYTQKIIDLYEADNPNITIEPTFSGFADYWDRLATAAAGGDAPDVMQHESRYVREYAGRGALLDLSEYSNIIDTESLDPAVMETGVLDGSMYAIPIGINAHAVIADPQVFADTGIPMPDDKTWTYPDAIRIATEISEAAPEGTYGWQMTTAIDTSFEIFARQRGEALFDEEGKLGFDRETMIEWWDYQKEFHETGAAPSASRTVELEAADIDGSLFSTNQGAMSTAWSNQLPTFETVAGRPLEMLRMPGEGEGEAGTYYKPSQFWAASADTEHPEEAASFIDFLLNDPRVAEIQLSERGLPVNTELRDEVLAKLTPADQKAAAFLEEIEPEISPPPPLPPQGAGEVQGILFQLNEQVLFDQLTTAEATDAFIEQVEAAIGG